MQGPLFFLVYINDLAVDLSSHAKLFADDASLFTIVLLCMMEILQRNS